jgi:hypothetical protein
MVMKKRLMVLMCFVCMLLASGLFAATLKVGKTGGDFTKIMDAVKAAMDNDVIMIIDNETYNEQVTIDSTKHFITLTSKNPTSLSKPTIMFQDKINVHPANYKESQADTTINFDKNGALRILKTHHIIIDGIAIDGGGAYYYGYPSIWNQKDPLQFGNAALTLWLAGRVTVRNCDISNAYFGINFKDRNVGGIFANPNPADIDTSQNVPLSGFALSGNHIIEYNRIHTNSTGLYFESSWDLGSTIRYNLIYGNHHSTEKVAADVKGLTSDGNNQPGGAFMFKDQLLSPLAIYNNTFYDNNMIFIGHWRIGYQHLVFNNIFAKPYKYWSDATNTFGNAGSSMEITPCMPNRIYNCIYSCQERAPQASYISVMNGMPQIQGTGGVAPDPGVQLTGAGGGATITWPAASDNRWLEMNDGGSTGLFLSLSPASTNFLEPNWNDDNVKQFISHKGWEKSGVKNTDGSRADIGAIEQLHGIPPQTAAIQPTMPILIKGGGTSATIAFNLEVRVPQTNGVMTDATITKMLYRFVKLPYDSKKDPFGQDGKPAYVITGADMTDITPVPASVKLGPNTFSVTIPTPGDYAFIELFIEGVGADGNKFSTVTGFLPYRKLQYIIDIKILDKSSKSIDTIRVGDTVTLQLTPQKADGTAFTSKLTTTSAVLQSSNLIFTPVAGKDSVVLKYTVGIQGADKKPVIFTKIPPGGGDNITASGTWLNTSTNTPLALLGTKDIYLLSGPPDHVLFRDPYSRSRKLMAQTLNAGLAYPCTVDVYDKYGNFCNSVSDIKVTSLKPDIAVVIGGNPDTTVKNTTSGLALFSVQTTITAMEGDKATFMAIVPTTLKSDTGDMIVGARAEHLFILYSDTLLYDAGTQLRGQVGDKMHIVVIATKSLTPSIDSILTTIPGNFTLTGSSAKMMFYDSPSATAATNKFKLTNGRVDIWVSSTDTLANASLSTASNDIVKSPSRDQIYFTRPIVSIDSASFFANNGFGRVDSVEIYFQKKLTLISDSIALFWPNKMDSSKKVIKGTDAAMRLSADSMRITIVLNPPYGEAMTGARTVDLGITYNRPNNNPGVQGASLPFDIKDKVGPLIMTAQVVERVDKGPGIDTMFVSFSEPIAAASLTGASLELIQKSGKSTITINNAVPSAGVNTFKLIVTSSNPPQKGDSLRIFPQGSITDSLANPAHPLNRPVEIKIKSIPGQITAAYYIDNERQRADGLVDSVIIQFKKKVDIGNMTLDLQWTGAGANPYDAKNLKMDLMKYLSADSTLIEIAVKGQFSGLAPGTIRTGGKMAATIKYTDIPDITVNGDVADSAGPVVVDSAIYYPAPRPFNQATHDPDTLYVTFSEQLMPIANTAIKPFITNHASSETDIYPIYFKLPESLTSANPIDGKFTYKFIVDQSAGENFPQNGDSLRIDPAAGIKDSSAQTSQLNPNNIKVPLNVHPIPYKYVVLLSKNPYTPKIGIDSIFVILDTKVKEGVKLEAMGTIYDVLGNVIKVVDWAPAVPDPNPLNPLKVTLLWDGANKYGRVVGTGVYVADLAIRKDGIVIERSVKKIGVKR